MQTCKRTCRVVLLLGMALSMLVSRAEAGGVTAGSLSNLHVTGIAQDAYGYIWFATAKGLCRYNGYEYVYYYNDPDDYETLPFDRISGLHVDKEGNLWIATAKGICTFDRKSGKFIRFPLNEVSFNALGFYEHNGRLLAHGQQGIAQIDEREIRAESFYESSPFTVITLASDSRQRLWAGVSSFQSSRILCFNGQDQPDGTLELPEVERITSSYAHRDGTIWFGTTSGIVIADPESRQLVGGYFPAPVRQILQTLSVTVIAPLSHDRLFIGTENRGIYLYDTARQTLFPAAEENLFRDVTSNHITACFIDQQDNLWIGTLDKGYVLETAIRKQFNPNTQLEETVADKLVTSIAQDRDRNLWIGTHFDGILRFRPGVSDAALPDAAPLPPFNRSNRNYVKMLYCDAHNRLWVAGDNFLSRGKIENGCIAQWETCPEKLGIVTFAEDSSGRVWAGSSRSGIYVFDRALAHPVHIQLPGYASFEIKDIIPYTAGSMLFVSTQTGVCEIDVNSLEFRPVNPSAEFRAFGENAVTLFLDERSRLWIGTYGNGLGCYDLKTGMLTRYTIHNGMPSNDVMAIRPDGQGDLWLSTSFGLSRFSPEKERFINYYDFDGTQGNLFFENSALADSAGMLYFGGSHGLTFFDPAQIEHTVHRIPVRLEDLRVFNQSIGEGESHRELYRSFRNNEEIVLTHRQNVFSIDYAGLELSAPQKIQYAYQLEGFDRKWNHVGPIRRASYSNLPPGEYTFKVRADNGNGLWDSAPVTEMRIRITPSFWWNQWSIGVYALLVVAICIAFIRLYTRNLLHKGRLELSEREKAQEKEVSRMKEDFFANISHELRTPLTLIYGNITLLEKEKTPAENAGKERGFDQIKYNISRLLRLIDQLLDFGRIDSDTLSLSVRKENIVSITRTIMHNFTLAAAEKQIALELECREEELEIPVDADKMDKILSNLLSNALKFTPQEGTIRIVIQKKNNFTGYQAADVPGGYVEISVVDNGSGVAEEELGQLFQRFRQLGDGKAGYPGGVGIGLNYVRALVRKHKGDVLAERRSPQGMIFRFILPAEMEVYTPEEQRPAQDVAPAQETVPRRQDDTDNGYDAEDTGRKKVLVVEDEPEIRQFLCSFLREDYRVFTENDGKKGLERALEIYPDLVISDVLMPEMDGYELCGQIKENPEISHIPVILLTAKTREEDHIAGYSKGADGYLNKPFHPALLSALIETLFRNRELQRNRLLQHPPPDQEPRTDVPALNPLDQKFMDRLYRYMDEHLVDNPSSIVQLGEEMGFSRSSFYRKVKSLTGQTPSDFLRIYRLNRAAELIRTGGYNLTEICFMTGFEAYSHFSASFKKQFGLSPRDYKVEKKVPKI